TSSVDLTPRQMLRSGSFWVIYLMMTMVAFSGLVVTAQLSPIAKFYNVDKGIVAFGMSALVLAIEVDQVLNVVVTTLLGVGVGPYRPGKHGVYRLQLGGTGGVRSTAADPPAGLVYPSVRLVFLRLGRDLL